MATAEQLKALVKSHFENDSIRFRSIAMQLAAGEAKKGHMDLANEIRSIVDQAKETSASVEYGISTHIATPQGELADLLTCSYPKTRLSEMVLAPHLTKRLHRILDEQKHVVKLKSHGLHPRQRLLLTGPPGCGKTMTASALAGELGIPLFVVRLDGLITKFMGETTAKLRLIFDAIHNTRAVYLFDEFDSIGAHRNSGTDVGEIRRVLNSFLMFIEQHKSTSLLIAATNNPHSLDAALFRRFDDLLEFDLPNRELIKRVAQGCLSSQKTKALDYNKISVAANGMSFAEISKSIEEAIKDSLIHERSVLTTKDLLKSLKERRSFLRKGKK